MKKLFFMNLMLLACLSQVMAQEKQASIKFDKLNYNFGKFSESAPIQKCTFTFTNTGDAPLVINQAVASCGCTIPSYTKKPVKPGETGKIEVTYDGKGKFPGHFKKSITVRTNGVPEMIRLYIEGIMEEVQ